jgi:hypothetical protein
VALTNRALDAPHIVLATVALWIGLARPVERSFRSTAAA